MKQKCPVIIFLISLCLLSAFSVSFAFSGKPEEEWKNQTMLRMSVPYERSHPTGKAAEYFAGLVEQGSGGRMAISVTYDTEPGSEKEIVTQLQFGGIAIAAVNYFSLCEEIPEINRFIGSYDSPQEAREGYRELTGEIQEYLSRERLELLSCYRPDYRCVATKERPESPGDFTGMRLHAAKVLPVSAYLVNLGAEIENFERTDLLRAVDSGFIDGSEMPLLLYKRAGYDKVMPYVWIYKDFLAPDMLVASTVSLGNLSDEQRRLLFRCAEETEEFQIRAMIEAQKERGME